MTRILRNLFLILAVCFSCSLYAQNNRLYTTQQGLQTCDISCLLVDNRGLLWIGGSSSLCYFSGNYFSYIDNHSQTTGKLLYNNIKQIVEDKEDCYWVITDGGLFYFDSRTLQHERVMLSPEETDETAYPVRQLLDLSEDGKQKLVTTDGYGIFVLNNETHTIDQKLTDEIQKLVQESFVAHAMKDSQGNLWIARIRHTLVKVNLKQKKAQEIAMTEDAKQLISKYTTNDILEVPERNAIYFALDGGVTKYDLKQQKMMAITDNLQIPFTSMLMANKHQCLVGSDSHGLWIISEQDEVTPYKLTESTFDLSMAKVKDITMDKQGNILVALMQKGLYIIPERTEDFRYFPMSLHGDGRNTSCVTAIQIDKQGRYWIATDGAGVFSADAQALDSAKPINKGLNSLQVQTIAIDKRGTVWAGSYGGGVQYHIPGTDGFVTPGWEGFLAHAPVMDICYDENMDLLYVATNGAGVHVMDLSSQQCTQLSYDKYQNAWVSGLHLDEEGTLWIVEVNNIHYTNERTGKKGNIPHLILPGQPICINSIGKGENKQMLIGTTEGLLVYNTWDGEANWLLKNKKIQSINCTENAIWAATSNTIYAIDRKTNHETEYRQFGGYFLGEFHKRSAQSNNQGDLLWGCDNGILKFAPKAIQKPHHLHNKVVLTSIITEGRFISFQNDSDIIDANILCATKVNLKHGDSFSVSFAIPDFTGSSNITYLYKLQGVDTEWNATDFPRLHYPVLQAGKYTLHVKACIDGICEENTECTITINVQAPWYASWWAYLIYILLVAGVFYALRQLQLTRKKREMELQESRRNEEIKEAKLQLFTSIAHELRSPLTMIVTPLRYLLTNTEDEEVKKNLNIMQQNCNRLLNTVRQITDIRRIDAGQFQLHFTEVNICQYIEEVTKSFMGAAMVRKLNLTVENSEPEIMAWIDTEHFEKIVVNILSNAFKFTPEGGKIRVRNQRKDNELEISIFNEGEHISEEDFGRLYERFFQTKKGKKSNGSGIGLNLCHELVQLHHGTIEAHNIDPTGVEFTVHIPLGSDHLTAEELSPRQDKDDNEESKVMTMNTLPQEEEECAVEDIIPEKDTTSNENIDKQCTMPKLLLVDDDVDICNYLAEYLQSEFTIITAHGGNSAWELVLQHRPDIVITDVMMPDGSGIDLAKRIKSNPELDNTPIIMVTGEDNETLQLQSFQLNVDHYLQKPFNISILQATINQVLRVRENTRKHTKRTDFGDEYGKMDIESSEEAMFKRITKALQEHLDDSEYGVKELSAEVGISRVHLNRKMKDRFGLSPNAFIKTFRLKQAGHLLIHNNVNVSEVAYKVGFNTHSHFSSSFRDFFGMSPKDFVTFYKKEENQETLKKLLE